MTPAARHAAAITVLDRWLDGVPVEKALTGWARGARYAGSKDRAAVRDHVFDVLRMKGRCARLGRAETGRGLILGLLRLRGEAPAEVFTGDGYAPAALTPEEQTPPADDPEIDLDVPNWLMPALQARFDQDLPRALVEMGKRAPVYLRLNQRKADASQVIDRLRSSGVDAVESADCATALEVRAGARQLRQASAYLDGLVEIQDLSVQRAMGVIDWPLKGRVLDYCAGGGGKALAIAAISDAEITVHDAHPKRMADIPARATRAGVRLNMCETDALAAEGPFDLVLCDVPCSGSGTWRRDPEAKWRLTPDRLAELCQLQADILEKAAALVRRGGRIVYMTCSLFHDENEAQVSGFLARNPDWRQTVQHFDTPLTASDGFFVSELTQLSETP